MFAKQLTIEEIYEAYTDACESFEDVKASLDELQIELEDEVSGLTAVLDEVRDQLEQCRRQFRQFSRKVNPGRMISSKHLAGEPDLKPEAAEMVNFLSDIQAEEPVLPFL